jgi:hypothetical protein
MKRKLILALIPLFGAAAALLYTLPAFSYLPNFSGSTPWHWANATTQWNLNTSVGSNVIGGSVVPTLQASFATWSTAPNTSIHVSQGANTQVATAADDGINMICFICNDSQFSNSSGSVSDTIAFTIDTVQRNGQIIDADMLFNPQFTFLVGNATCPSGDTNCEDLQSIATHEIGHFFGLDHSAIASAVMYPFQGSDPVRDLGYDDVAGISSVYPGTQSVPTGKISGTVRYAGTNNPVCGAHVFADFVSANSSYPSPVRRTPIGAITGADGTYTITGLPVDSYTITAEPLDGPVTKDNINYSCNGTLPTNFTTRQH